MQMSCGMGGCVNSVPNARGNDSRKYHRSSALIISFIIPSLSLWFVVEFADGPSFYPVTNHSRRKNIPMCSMTRGKQRKLGGNVLLEPAAAMVHMFSLVMFGLCSPCSLTNQWDKLPIDLLEVYFPKWELPWRLI